jgi:hypothetical protein
LILQWVDHHIVNMDQACCRDIKYAFALLHLFRCTDYLYHIAKMECR